MMATQTQVELWTVGQAAHFLKMSTSWVYQAASAGRLPAVRIGRSVRFDGEALRQWVASQATRPAPAAVVHFPKKG
jgi:hypothetical protein